MDYKSLEKELEILKSDSILNLTAINRLSAYYKIICINSEDAVKAIESQISKLNTIDNSLFSHSENISSLFKVTQEATKKTNNLLYKFDKEIISTIDIFHNNISVIYDESIESFDQIIKELIVAREKLDLAQMIYYKSAYDAQQLDNTVNKIEGNDEGSLETSEKSVRLKSQTHNNEQLYIYEVGRYNHVISECNVKYNAMMILLKQNEDSRLHFIKLSFGKFMKLIDEFNSILKDLIRKVNALFDDNVTSQIKELVSSINDNIITVNGKECQIKHATFESYKDYCNKTPITEESFDIETFAKPVLHITEEAEMKIIEQSVNGFLSDNDISLELIAELLEVFNYNSDNRKRFLDEFLKKKSNVWITFPNYDNLVHFSNIICYISINHDSIFSGKFEHNFTIVFLSERIFYFDTTTMNKVYLSALLSTNLLYRTNAYWKDIIELKLAIKVDDHILPLKQMKTPEEGGLFSKLGSSLGNTLGFNNSLKKNSIINNSRIKQFIPHYDDLPLHKIPTLDSIGTTELITIIKETIPNLANFNFPTEKAIELISELEKEYRIPKEQTELFITYYKVSSYTIRRRLLNAKNYNDDGKYELYQSSSLLDRHIKLIKHSIDYLEQKDYLSLMLLNKTTYKELSMKIFKYVLKRPNLSNKLRLIIWSNILTINNLKKTYDYNSLKTDLSDLSEQTKTEIMMDVPRTFISGDLNEEKTKLQIQNVLNAICQVNDDVKYCQGMNYLAQFLLEITHDEEMAFYIFLGFFKLTEYPLIFAQHLEKMTLFFHVFKRLVSLYEPELSNYFNSTNFEVQCFLARWFITVFQSVRPSVQTPGIPLVLVKILDGFITSGWKSLMKVSLNVLRYYETELLKMKYEDLLQFLVNSTVKYEFFDNSNIVLYDKMMQETKIPKKLVEYIEKEYKLDPKYKINKH